MSIKISKFNCTIIKVTDFDVFVEEHKNKSRFSLDTETNSLNVFSPEFQVGCITISFDGSTGYYLPMGICNIRKLNRFLEGKQIIFANAKFDIHALYRMGVMVKADEDVILLYHCLYTSRKTNKLKALAWLIGFGGYDEELDAYRKKYKISNFLEIPEEILMKYATLDAIVTYRLWDNAVNVLVPSQPDVYKMYKSILIPLIEMYVDIEREGLDIDIPYMNQLNALFSEQKNVLATEICRMLGVNINVNSTTQLGYALENKGLPNHGRGEEGAYSTQESILLRWKKEGFEIAEIILRYRTISKLQEAFVGEYTGGIDLVVEDETEGDDDVVVEEASPFEQLIIEDDTPSGKGKKNQGLVKFMTNGKVYPSYGVAMTEPLRQSCSSPNIQQFPKSEEARKIFKAPEGYTFAELDISGFHPRLIAFLSGDPALIDVFVNQGGDLHSMTAQAVFCRDMTLAEFIQKKKEEPYATYRFRAKAINFLFMYNGSPKKLAPVIELEWTKEQMLDYIQKNKCKMESVMLPDKTSYIDIPLTVATDIHAKYMETYYKIPVFAYDQIQKANRDGYIDCMYGARRHLIELKYYNHKEKVITEKHRIVEKGLKNIAVNTEIIMTEALIMDIYMKKVWDELREKRMKSKIIGMIHDSIVFKLWKEEAKEVYDLNNRILKENFSFGTINLESEFKMGDVWGFSPEVKL